MRKPIRDITGRQYGETVRGATVRVCSGEVLALVEYEGEDNEHVFRAFARDVEQGKYAGRIIYSTYTALAPDKDSTVLYVHLSELMSEPYMWGQEPR